MENNRTAFTDMFIRRPVLAIVVNLIIIIMGIQAYNTLTVRQYPRNENAVISITTAYVGANADLVRGFITTPIERAIAAADGIDFIESTSAQGLSTINVHLRLNYDGNRALSEISTKVDKVRGDLPPEAEVPVLTIQTADSQVAAAYLRFKSDILEANEVTDYLSRVVQPRFTAVPGVQRADILGARTYAMRIWLKPDRMASFNISPAEVRRTLAANNYLSTVGQTRGSLITVNLTADTDLRTPEDFKRLVLRQSNDVLVRLEDVADVVLGAETYDVDVRFSGDPAVFMGVWVLPSANTLDVIRGIRAEMEALQKELPVGMTAGFAYDSTAYIEDAIKEVYSTLTETLIIVIIVIFLFLGSVRSALVPVIAIPISLIGAVFIMQLLGFSINLLTLLAVVLSVGIVVDDAIVVVENVERHLSMGKSPLTAALHATRELVGPIISMTVTLAVVYVPIGLAGGLTGTFFREFAFTLAGAVAISGIVALTLSPMLSSRFLRPNESERGFAGVVTRIFERIRHRYSSMLDVMLSSRGFIYVGWVLLSVLAIVMFILSPKELAPLEDQGFIMAFAETPSNGSIEQMVHFTEQVHEAFTEVPEYVQSFQITQPTSAFAGTSLKPWSQRDRTVKQVIPDLQARMNRITGIRTMVASRPALPSGGQFPVEFVIASTADHEQILALAQELQKRAVESGLFAFPPMIDMKFDQPQSEVKIDRDKVAMLGLDLSQVGQDMSAAMGGNYVNRFSMDSLSFKVIPQVKRIDRLNPDQLENLYVTGPDGNLVQLSTVAHIEDTVQPRSLNRFQQLNAVKISGVTVRSLDEALTFLEDEASKILPRGYAIDYTGESRQFRKEGGNSAFLMTFGLATILIFLVLAAQFNSFRDPLIILLGSVPLAMFGSMIFTFLKMPVDIPYWTNGWTTTFNIYTQVGLVTLIGLIAKNGILIVEFANSLQREGKSKLVAVHEATLTRLRPILMTTAATVCGHFPLVLVTGAGAAARNSIGLVLVGGMAIGTLFTLFVVPALYMLIAKDHGKDADLVKEA